MTSLTKPNRVVVDSNVWISALVFGGTPRRALKLFLERGDTIVVSAEIITEVRRTLVKKFPDFHENFKTLLRMFAPRLEFVWLGDITITVARDPDDNIILETAVLGKAVCIITGDNDLLVLQKYDSVKILKASDWVGLS